LDSKDVQKVLVSLWNNFIVLNTFRNFFLFFPFISFIKYYLTFHVLLYTRYIQLLCKIDFSLLTLKYPGVQKIISNRNFIAINDLVHPLCFHYCKFTFRLCTLFINNYVQLTWCTRNKPLLFNTKDLNYYIIMFQ